MHGDNPARRTVLATVGTLCSGALAGCSGSDTTNPEGGDNEETAGSQESNSESGNGQSGSNGEDEPTQELASQEPQSRAEEQLYSAAESRNDAYALKFDNLEYIDGEGLESSSEESLRTYQGALNDALEVARQGESPYTMWVGFEEDGHISFYPNLEEDKAIFDGNTFIGTFEEFDHDSTGDPDSELLESEYTEFIEERLDGEGVSNHLGEIPEYAQEALESGWQAQ